MQYVVVVDQEPDPKDPKLEHFNGFGPIYDPREATNLANEISHRAMGGEYNISKVVVMELHSPLISLLSVLGEAEVPDDEHCPNCGQMLP